MMKRSTLTRIALLALYCCVVPAVGWCQVPLLVDYQGFLTSTAGTPTNGTASIVFSLYDASGRLLWDETHNPVTVKDGVFNVTLGGVDPVGDPLVPAHFDGPLYLGVAVGGDPEMTPRQRLTSAPYALKSLAAENSDTLDGVHLSALATASHTHDSTTIVDEAGVAAAPEGSASLTGSVSMITSVTLDAPAAGKVLVTATGSIRHDYSSGTGGSTAELYLDTTAVGQGNPIESRLINGLPAGLYSFPFANTALFTVAAGPNTFYLNGFSSTAAGRTISVVEARVTAVYFPSQY